MYKTGILGRQEAEETAAGFVGNILNWRPGGGPDRQNRDQSRSRNRNRIRIMRQKIVEKSNNSYCCCYERNGRRRRRWWFSLEKLSKMKVKDVGRLVKVTLWSILLPSLVLLGLFTMLHFLEVNMSMILNLTGLSSPLNHYNVQDPFGYDQYDRFPNHPDDFQAYDFDDYEESVAFREEILREQKLIDDHYNEWKGKKQTKKRKQKNTKIKSTSLPLQFKKSKTDPNVKAWANDFCKLPRLSSGGLVALKYDNAQLKERYQGNPPECLSGNDYTRFEIDLKSNLIRIDPGDSFWSTAFCHYKVFYRDPQEPDFRIRTRKKIFRISENKTKLEPDHEFIEIRCTTRTKGGRPRLVYEDELSHVPLKPEVEARSSALFSKLKKFPPRLTNQKLTNTTNHQHVENATDKTKGPNVTNHYSVLILGLDSISHQSFNRHMTRSREYLISQLAAIPFHGFHSLGAITRENIFPMLTGYKLSELKFKINPQKSYLEDSQRTGAGGGAGGSENESGKLEFIWKEFEKFGYRTSYAEDAIPWSIFNGNEQLGFRAQPFDYDFRTLTQMSSNDQKEGHNLSSNNTLECHGSRLMFQTLLDNLLKTAYTLKGKPFWHMTWSNLLTYNVNEYAKFGDKPLLKTLIKLNSHQLLQNTILILMSGHGNKWGGLKKYTEQGFLEEKLPLLYIVLPESFEAQFPQETLNLLENSKKKLVTTFDLHTMMKHLLKLQFNPAPQPKPKPIERTREKSKIQNQRPTFNLKKEEIENCDRNISLFERISPLRTCATIGVKKSDCACLHRVPVWFDPKLADFTRKSGEGENSNSNSKLPPPTVNKANTLAHFVVSTMNTKLRKSKFKDVCARIELRGIYNLYTFELAERVKTEADKMERPLQSNMRLETEFKLEYFDSDVEKIENFESEDRSRILKKEASHGTGNGNGNENGNVNGNANRKSRIKNKKRLHLNFPLKKLPVQTFEIELATQPGNVRWYAAVRVHVVTGSMTLAQIVRLDLNSTTATLNSNSGESASAPRNLKNHNVDVDFKKSFKKSQNKDKRKDEERAKDVGTVSPCAANVELNKDFLLREFCHCV